MIFPEFFPEDRNNEFAEKKVFEQLKKASQDYDIFYSKKFINKLDGVRPEYEIDFIICIPEKAIICLEVKGGKLHYSGMESSWFQNGMKMKKDPDSQASSASHSLLHTFKEHIGDMSIGWALCFPDCELDGSKLPPSISKEVILDQHSLLYSVDALPFMFDYIMKQNPRKGVRKWQYEKFKSLLLRDIGFVQVLSTKFKYQEDRFIRLTQRQLDFFGGVRTNRAILTQGPAGSGKTIIAKTLAKDFLTLGLKVLFVCYNRTLANKIRYEFDRNEENLKVTTFHSLGRDVISNYDASWWNQQEKNTDFWELEMPAKMESVLSNEIPKYDVLIVDEGQDLKSFWYDCMYKMITPESGKYFIFKDSLQDIFGRDSEIPSPINSSFMQFNLKDNCRNTKNIVNYLTESVGRTISCFSESPEGEKVVIIDDLKLSEKVKFLENEIRGLVHSERILLSDVLVIINSTVEESILNVLKEKSKLNIHYVDNKGRMSPKDINYSTINVFKGLEADVVFLVDTRLIIDNKHKKLYTEASRARKKLYIIN